MHKKFDFLISNKAIQSQRKQYPIIFVSNELSSEENIFLIHFSVQAILSYYLILHSQVLAKFDIEHKVKKSSK